LGCGEVRRLGFVTKGLFGVKGVWCGCVSVTDLLSQTRPWAALLLLKLFKLWWKILEAKCGEKYEKGSNREE